MHYGVVPLVWREKTIVGGASRELFSPSVRAVVPNVGREKQKGSDLFSTENPLLVLEQLCAAIE